MSLAMIVWMGSRPFDGVASPLDALALKSSLVSSSG